MGVDDLRLGATRSRRAAELAQLASAHWKSAGGKSRRTAPGDRGQVVPACARSRSERGVSIIDAPGWVAWRFVSLRRARHARRCTSSRADLIDTRLRAPLGTCVAVRPVGGRQPVIRDPAPIDRRDRAAEVWDVDDGRASPRRWRDTLGYEQCRGPLATPVRRRSATRSSRGGRSRRVTRGTPDHAVDRRVPRRAQRSTSTVPRAIRALTRRTSTGATTRATSVKRKSGRSPSSWGSPPGRPYPPSSAATSMRPDSDEIECSRPRCRSRSAPRVLDGGTSRRWGGVQRGRTTTRSPS